MLWAIAHRHHKQSCQGGRSAPLRYAGRCRLPTYAAIFESAITKIGHRRIFVKINNERRYGRRFTPTEADIVERRIVRRAQERGPVTAAAGDIAA